MAGNKHVVQPVIAWLLQKPEDLKKRAYLAKFLVKLEVPLDFHGDQDINELYEKVQLQYQLILFLHEIALNKEIL